MKNIRTIAVTAAVMISMLLPTAFTVLAAPGGSAGHGCHNRRSDDITEYYCEYHQDYHTDRCESRGHDGHGRGHGDMRHQDGTCYSYTE